MDLATRPFGRGALNTVMHSSGRRKEFQRRETGLKTPGFFLYFPILHQAGNPLPGSRLNLAKLTFHHIVFIGCARAIRVAGCTGAGAVFLSMLLVHLLCQRGTRLL